MVCQIAGGKNTGDRCAGGTRLDFDIAAIVGFQNVFDQFCRWRMADRDKDTGTRNFGDLAGLDVFGFHTRNAKRHIGAHDFLKLVEPEGFDFLVFKEPLLQDLFSPQLVATVNEGYF